MTRSMLLVGVLLLAAASASAQYVEKGDQELQFSGSFFSVSGVTMINMSGLYGYYQNEQLEIGGGPSLTYVSFSAFGFSTSTTTLGLTAFTKYNFTARERIVPYLGGQWYQYDLSPGEPFSFTDFSFIQVGGGFKYFLNEHVAYDFSGNLGFSLGGGDVAFLGAFGVAAFF